MVIARTIYWFNRTAIGIGARVSFVIGYNHRLIHHQLGSSFRACAQLPFMEIMRARAAVPLSCQGLASFLLAFLSFLGPPLLLRARICSNTH